MNRREQLRLKESLQKEKKTAELSENKTTFGLLILRHQTMVSEVRFPPSAPL
ncbi:hypothetical protein [Legionella sp.]|uniref:hypothetical protein n=1 Tax=Legionella sp. TaxID=459 RepID=UPI00325BE54B